MRTTSSHFQLNESKTNTFDYFQSKWNKIRWPDVTEVCCLMLLAIILWGIGYSLFGNEVGLTSQMFALFGLFILGKFVGVLVGVIQIPPMIGMLAVGVLFKNCGFINLTEDYKAFTAVLRQLALVNILLPAGLGLNPTALRKMSAMVISLSLVPPAVEVLAVTILSYYIMNLPWLWGLLLGLLLGAVSPAVIIPCLFELQDDGYGVNKSIHTLVIAASTLDDIACIAGFGIVIGVVFSTGSLLMQILEGPIVLAIGTTYGFLFGILAQFIPHPESANLTTLRTLLIGSGSVLAAVGSQAIGYGGAGTLGCIIAAFVACIRWRKQGWDQTNPVKDNFSLLWKFFEPISFCLIGIEMDFSVLEADVVLWGTITMIAALVFRMLTSVLLTYKSNLNLKETIFVAIAAIPKATVQAALGPVALDYAGRAMNSEDYTSYANALLIVSVLSIIVTSPIGALLIMQLGPRLLHQTLSEEKAIGIRTLSTQELDISNLRRNRIYYNSV